MLKRSSRNFSNWKLLPWTYTYYIREIFENWLIEWTSFIVCNRSLVRGIEDDEDDNAGADEIISLNFYALSFGRIRSKSKSP